MNVKVISRNVGYALLVSALFMFLSIIVSVANGNDSALAALLISFTITFTVGIFPFIFVKKTSAITLKDAFMIIVLSWLLSFVFGMLPYALYGGPFTVVNAWYESVSGFTTTGSTILENVEALPDSLLFWRSSTHFIGGLGVVVFLLLLIPNSSQMRLRLSSLELSSLSKQGYRSRTNKTVSIFAIVYLALLVCTFLSYLLVGMEPFDAINHAMTVAATGGFSVKNLSIAAYDSHAVNLVTIFFMFLASIHYGMIFTAILTRSFKPFKNEVFRFYLFGLVFGAVIVATVLKAKQIEPTWADSIIVAVFQTVSYSSTTGLAIADNNLWPYALSVFLMFFGIRCGMAGSTTGGLKSDRVLLLYKQLGYNFKKILHPASVQEVRLDGKVISQENIAPHVLYVALYVILILFSCLLGLALGVDFENSLMSSVSALGNIGPSVGEYGFLGNYNSMPTGAKLLYSVDMFLGRVEIYPIFAVMLMMVGRKEYK